jgi:hypothetical protein
MAKKDKDINFTIAEDRAHLKNLIDSIAESYRPQKKELLKERPENWLSRHDRLDKQFVYEVQNLISSGILNGLHLVDDGQLKPNSANGVVANYKKEIIIRGEDFIFTFFNFGSKQHTGLPDGATTPYHGHTLRCAATAFIPKGLSAKDCATPIQITFEGVTPVKTENLIAAKTSIRQPETGLESAEPDRDYHVVFNGDPTKPAYTLHFYLTKGVGVDESGKPVYIDISKDEFPKTAIGVKTDIRGLPGLGGKIIQHKNTSLVPLTHYTQLEYSRECIFKGIMR